MDSKTFFWIISGITIAFILYMREITHWTEGMEEPARRLKNRIIFMGLPALIYLGAVWYFWEDIRPALRWLGIYL